jgi:cytochrome c oxidase subunit 2
MRVLGSTSYTMPTGVGRRLLVASIACTGTLVLANAALAGSGGLLPVSSHSPNAHKISDLYVVVLIFSSCIFVAVEAALVVIVLRYRRGRRPVSVEGPQIHGSARLEVFAAVVPAVLVAALVAVVLFQLSGITNAPAASAAGETTVTVEGRQFYWMFRYPNGAVSIGTLIVPAGEVVHENVVAPRDDVSHSWWIPGLGAAVEAVPGRTNHTWFRAPAGTYSSSCSDLCSSDHARMAARIDVVTPAAYERFIDARAAAPASITVGKEEFQNACATCHTLDTPYLGPALADNPQLTEVSELSGILRQGTGTMPAVGSDWSNAQIDALVKYTTKLVNSQPAGATSGSTG